jgi:hypothetical protein
MTSTQAAEITTRKGADRYDGTPTVEVVVAGVAIGTVYKAERRTPRYAGNTRICSGYSVRKVWGAEGRNAWRSGWDRRPYRCDLDATKAKAIAGLVAAHAARVA